MSGRAARLWPGAGLAPALALLAACHPHGGEGAGSATLPGDTRDHRAYAGIAADETFRFTGTEPFWGGSVRGDRLVWTTPEAPDGTAIAVQRFAGRGGLSWNGTLDGQAFVLTATPSACGDGMSDRTYPFTVMVLIGGGQRGGCGWSDRHRYSEARRP